MKTVGPTLVVIILALSSFPVVSEAIAADMRSEGPGHLSVVDIKKVIQEEKMNRARNGQMIAPTNLETDFFSYEDGLYPVAGDDGAYGETQTEPEVWGENYVSDIMYSPPYNSGGGYSSEASGGAGDYSVGSTHESYVGDQNENGVLEWISYYSYRPWGEDGIDNDGDGCVDEKTYGDWDGQTGCDLVPDQIDFFALGGLPDVGGKHGTLAVTTDWYSQPNPVIRLYRIFGSELWETFDISLFAYYPQVVDNEDIISYYAPEYENSMNGNPERDGDYNDWFVGSIDARDYPATPPENHICFAGYRLYMGISALRPDGYVVTSFELHEEYDKHDWNGDKDYKDMVAAYYVVDPVDGSCDQGVNGGVSGPRPRNSGKVMTPGSTQEDDDDRDWNGDGDKGDIVLLWHDIDSTWNLVGGRYTSYTFTHTPGSFGFGFWGIYSDQAQLQGWPIEAGGAYYKLLNGSGFDPHAYHFLISDEDGDPQTYLPAYYIGVGQPGGTITKSCFQIYAREFNLERAGVKLMGGQADGNGDGDTEDTLNYIYCPNEVGGDGDFWVEPTSKFAKGLYESPVPFIWAGYYYYCSAGDVNGYAINPSWYLENDLSDDADGDLFIGDNLAYHVQYWLARADLEILDTGWVGESITQPGGNALGRISLLNVGSASVSLNEDTLLYTDDNHWIQGLHVVDLENDNGILEPDEVADVYFALRISAGSPLGTQSIHIMVLHGSLFLETYMPLDVTLKMQSKDLACYRHRQNALRAIRSFDMDDDWEMLHDLEPGGKVLLDDYGNEAEPEKAVLQLVLWYGMGCNYRGEGGVRLAHSVGMRLTTDYGMGIDYWGFVPGQEEGNEGNGNGGLTGSSRHEVYGF